MPIELSWYIPNRVIYSRSYGVNSAADVMAIAPEYERMIAAGTAPLYLISDETAIERSEMTIAAVKDSFGYLKKFEQVISIGTESRFNMFLASVIAQFVGFSHKRFATVDEAIHFLKERDPSLVDYEHEPGS